MEASTRVARQVVAELVKAGVSTFVLCPGSRSAPLAYALGAAADAGVLTLHVEIDERVAGFVVLGAALAGKPAAVVTTSGSAVANLHPAVEEANHAGVPLIVLAADRPHELRGVRASQTADHRAILEGSVRFVTEIPAGAPHVRGQVMRAANKATGTNPGPVLINVAFREPLVPSSNWTDPIADCRFERPKPARHPVVVSGPSNRSLGIANLLHVAPNLGHVPILAEPTGELRSHSNAVGAHPLLLRTRVREQIDSVVVLGHPTLTREVSHLLADPKVSVFAVDEPAGYTDAAGTAHVVNLREVNDLLSNAEPGWLDRWLDLDRTAQKAIDREIGTELSFPTIARALTSSPVPTQLAASSIIRAVNLYGHAPAGPMFANRGLAGIDGTISTAIGAAIALGQPARVVVGDLAFIYDLGALAKGAGQKIPGLDVVVVDDHGGSLFATLDYGAGDEPTYDRLFRTEKDVDIEAATRAFGVDYAAPTTLEEFVRLLSQPDGVRITHVDLGRIPMGVERASRQDLGEVIVRILEP
ncbi:2-succinyl-5-enolpyruvyl-6-hydroxy-3-cyclohexene-1-carboxylate synthase [Trueperella bonasi]|uniref:2-succinyl-5-enolpyruvyl-6-hydroxy-3-cyclohexene-1-carboxylate synthase n=1 Tax=Trueperella bonasi TaxID=312286 RepID=A0ABT9NH17_9ACTO|nr:2-succinyl-5-enolpyruvyl-6-hydroxy-3-cyclohexene-1-carboxylic-acid synthase [Trueperella bonasi]MDP9806677.1 2-succinyl-5-enolpyruvyl-6-hydroxy-3-cyclohexene-1-carboxylate synthase [Trueperella bonasi]